MEKDLTIHDWMFRTGLRGNDLLLFALIYREEVYFATQRDVARFLNCTLPTAVKSICRLMDMGLVEQRIAKRKYSHQMAFHIANKETLHKKYSNE